MSVYDPYRAYCAQRKDAHQFRTLKETDNLADGRAIRDGQTLVNFSSNDYLGLVRHPLLTKRAHEFAEKYGAGATSSRLINGNIPPYAAIEKKLAAGKGYETALVMASGYQANVTVLAALADAKAVGKPVTVLADRLCHNSLLQGITLGGARLMRFQHNDCDHLAKLLAAQSDKDHHLIIVSESVFGMDGDCADLVTLGAIAKKHDALLYIDEAHATGVFGPGGFGLCAEHKGTADIAMGTFGKALGGFGAYIACRAPLRDYLIQRCGGLIYSTSLPPAVLGTIDAALELLPQLDKERAHVLTQATRLRDALRMQGWGCGIGTTQIIPVILGDEEAATTLADELRRNGFLVPAIRPPTVPAGTSRLRLSLSAAHKAADIDAFLSIMAQQAPRYITPAALAS